MNLINVLLMLVLIHVLIVQYMKLQELKIKNVLYISENTNQKILLE
jgi:hypothetical protein